MICIRCGEDKPTVSHHAPPRMYGGDDSDIVEVCRNCHHILEKNFWRKVTHPFGRQPKWENTKKRDIRCKRQRSYKALFSMTIEKYTYLGVDMLYNRETENMNIRTSARHRINRRDYKIPLIENRRHY